MSLPAPRPSRSKPPSMSSYLYKQKSWSPDIVREDAWQRRKGNHDHHRIRRSKSVTDEDIEELKGCMELGFEFDSPVKDQRLSDTFPAYELFYAVNKQYKDAVCKTSVMYSPISSTVSDCDSPSPIGSPVTIVGPGNLCVGEISETTKTQLRQWARVVACAVRQSSRQHD